MERAITHRWFYPYPPETVWEYLTNSELLAQWLMPNDFSPVAGHRFRFSTRPRVKFGFDGTIYCEVLEVIPGRKLSYSWKGGTGTEKVALNSLVTWTLTPKNNGTELLLEHSGFKGMKNYIPWLIMTKGWAKIGKRLWKRVNDKYGTASIGHLSGDR